MLPTQTPGRTRAPPRCHEILPRATVRPGLHRTIEEWCDCRGPGLGSPRERLRRAQVVWLRVVRCPVWRWPSQAGSLDWMPLVAILGAGEISLLEISPLASHANNRTESLPSLIDGCRCRPPDAMITTRGA